MVCFGKFVDFYAYKQVSPKTKKGSYMNQRSDF